MSVTPIPTMSRGRTAESPIAEMARLNARAKELAEGLAADLLYDVEVLATKAADFAKLDIATLPGLTNEARTLAADLSKRLETMRNIQARR
jgi:hypothetical protein